MSYTLIYVYEDLKGHQQWECACQSWHVFNQLFMCGVSSTTLKKNHCSSQFAFRESFRRGLQKVAEISKKGKDSNFHGFDGIFSYPQNLVT